jgi:hypothetical protein
MDILGAYPRYSYTLLSSKNTLAYFVAASLPDQKGMLVNASLEFTESSVHVIVLFVELVGLRNVGLESHLKL